MNKSITQDIQNEKQVSESIKRFFHRFHVSSALKQSNAYKKKGIPVIEVFQYLFLLIFSNRSMYMSLVTGKNTPSFAKDTIYRFMKLVQINWIRFTTILAARIIKNAIVPLDSEERVNVLTIDDSMFERCRSKKVELLAKVYDHAKHAYKFGFRMLTLGWTDGSTFIPVNNVLLSSENRKNRINDAASVDKRSVGYKRRQLSMEKGTTAMLELLKTAKNAGIPAKVVYVRNRNKKKDYLCLISTDISLREEEIIRIYGKRWDTEVFFKVCKSYLKLSRECNSLSYDAMSAHTAVVFTRYMMLSHESREANDQRSMGEILLYFTDEMADITWIWAFQMLLEMFRTILADNTELTEEKTDELVDTFMNTLPMVLKSRLQAA